MEGGSKAGRGGKGHVGVDRVGVVVLLDIVKDGVIGVAGIKIRIWEIVVVIGVVGIEIWILEIIVVIGVVGIKIWILEVVGIKIWILVVVGIENWILEVVGIIGVQGM